MMAGYSAKPNSVSSDMVEIVMGTKAAFMITPRSRSSMPNRFFCMPFPIMRSSLSPYLVTYLQDELASHVPGLALLLGSGRVLERQDGADDRPHFPGVDERGDMP